MLPYEPHSGLTMFIRQSQLTPDHPAILYLNDTITYAELRDESISFARKLAAAGVNKGDVVALKMGRSVDMIISLYAIWFVGGAYVPIDPTYPNERMQRMLEDSDVRWILTDEGLTYRRASAISTECCPPESLHSMAYLIYTSGSTGTPKGVMIGHNAIHHFIEGTVKKLQLENYRSILALTTVSFDIFILEVVAALATGLQVILASTKEMRNPRAITRLISKHQIEVVQMTPSRLTQLLNDYQFCEAIGAIRLLLIGGERIPRGLIRKLRVHTEASLYNMYGPTEATVWCAVYPIIGEEAVVGGPIGDTELLVMNGCHRVGVGEEGELCISGSNLAIGYWNNYQLNTEKFIQHPYREGARLYKTGDWVELRNDGTISVRGRLDDQVKIKGNRLELGEVEQRLLRHPTIHNAAIIALEGEDGSRLVACYTGEVGIPVAVYQKYLAEYLLEYMIPNHWFWMKQLPLTPAGKVDRVKLYHDITKS